MSTPQITTEVIEPEASTGAQVPGGTPFILGKGSDCSGFPSRSSVLPSADTVWKDYYDNVLRGDVDTYDGFETFVETSRTFSDNNPPSPTLSETGDSLNNDCAAGGGASMGGFVSTVLSPGGTVGTVNVDPDEIPSDQTPNSPLNSLIRLGHGSETNGSLTTPEAASLIQTTQGYSPMSRSPSYNPDSWGDDASPHAESI